MQVTETSAEGLKREYRVVVAAGDLDAKVNSRLNELKERVRINGFRPGKVPVSHLKRIYGRAVMAEAIEDSVREANASIVSDSGFKLALEPKVVLPETEAAMAEVMAGKADLAYSVELEILPKFELTNVPLTPAKLPRIPPLPPLTSPNAEDGSMKPKFAPTNPPMTLFAPGPVTVAFAVVEESWIKPRLMPTKPPR